MIGVGSDGIDKGVRPGGQAHQQALLPQLRLRAHVVLQHALDHRGRQSDDGKSGQRRKGNGREGHPDQGPDMAAVVVGLRHPESLMLPKAAG